MDYLGDYLGLMPDKNTGLGFGLGSTGKLRTDPLATRTGGYAETPGLPAAPGGLASSSDAGGGLGFWGGSGQGLASTLAMLSKAFAPNNYNKWGARVPTPQEKIAETMQQLSQAQLMAQALADGKTGGFNPAVMAMLFGGRGGQ